MFGSGTLDVAIGLVLIFLLVSLILTAVVEAIEGLTKTRAGDLERAIGLMLTQSDTASKPDALDQFYNHPLIFSLFKGEYHAERNLLVKGLTRILSEPARRFSSLPSYIPRDMFSAAALDLLRQGKGGKGLAAVVASLQGTVGTDVERLRSEVESWYDGVMDRAAGWYKRRTQSFLFVLGFATALALNINALDIAKHLTVSPEAQRAVVNLATNMTARPAANAGQPLTQDQINDLYSKIEAAGLPIGWDEQSIKRLWREPDTWSWLTALVGYLIVAFAAMLGAPFWFDMLNKIMVIRATVKPKEKSGDESSEDRIRGGAGSGERSAGSSGGESQALVHNANDGAVG